MALQWSEGFDNQAGSEDCLNGVLTSIVGSFALSAGTSAAGVTGRATYLTSASLGTAAAIAKQVAQTVIGFTHNNVQRPALISADDVVMWWAFYDTVAAAPQISVALDAATGVFTTYAGWAPYTGNGATGGGTLLGTSAAGLVPASAFFSVELSAKIDASAGFIQIRVNGLPVAGASVVGVNTQQTSHAWFDQVQYGSTISAGTNTYADIFDDFYIGDGTGSANTSWINPGVIVTRFATTNQSVQFTPLAGTNYQEISVNPFGGDSNYNSSPNVGNEDLFSDSGTLSGNYTPLFVKVQQVSRADNSSGRQAANLLVSNSSTVTGSSATKSTTYTYNDTYAINDPSTSGTWTQTSVDAVKWGYKVAG